MNTQDLFDELMASNAGGDIDANHSKVLPSHIEVQLWNGQRYMIGLTKLPDGIAYDPRTGQVLVGQ